MITSRVYKIKGNKTIENPEIPEHSGVYLFFSKHELLYIGKAKNLRKRIAQHFGNGFFMKHQFNPDEAWKVIVVFTKDEFDAERLESNLISLLPSKNNKSGNQLYNQDWYNDWKFGKGAFKDKQIELSPKGKEALKV